MSRLKNRFIQARRLILDLGASHIKLLLLAGTASRPRVIDYRLIDFHEEGLISSDEVNYQLRQVLDEYGDEPLTLVVPEHLTVSRIVDLPKLPRKAVAAAIANETFNLAGLGESSIVYDYSAIQPQGSYRHPYWVTLAQENEILGQVRRIGSAEENLVRVVPPSNALMSTFFDQQADIEQAVLVDIGATNSVVVIIEGGQGIHSVSFPIGAERFTEAIATEQGLSFEEAESIKRSQHPFQRLDEFPGLVRAVDYWLYELERLLTDWFAPIPQERLAFPTLKVLLSGGELVQPGLLPYLREKSVLDFQPWQVPSDAPSSFPISRYAVAYGAGISSLKQLPQCISLLPPYLKRTQEKAKRVMLMNWAALLSFILGIGVLIYATSQKRQLVAEKEALLKETKSALQEIRKIDELYRQKELEHAKISPLINAQQETANTLKMIPLLQAIRKQFDVWFLLFADKRSYFQGTTFPSGLNPTNQSLVARTNRLNKASSRQQGFITEVAIPGEAKSSLETRGAIVSALQEKELFQNVDALPAEQRITNWLDKNFVLSERTYTLQLQIDNTSTPAPKPLDATAIPTGEDEAESDDDQANPTSKMDNATD